MNLAKNSVNGQIAALGEIRCLIGLKSRDKILFVQKKDGEIVVSNISSVAICKAQTAFTGAAEALGTHNEGNIQFRYL